PAAVCELVHTAALNIVEALETAPATPLRRAEVLPPAERRRLLVEWSGREADAPPVTLPALFEAQVARTPDAPAVLAGDVEGAYAELNARANRLARWLAGRGVGPESLVAVVMDRSVDLVVALLGVLKA